MPELILPIERVHRSFVAAMAEFRAEGRGAENDNSMIGIEIRRYGERWSDPVEFAEYIAALKDDADEESPRPEGYVPATTLWYIEGNEYLGRLAIRHRLTPALIEGGGHIGYDIRPSARRRGHATAMLRSGLLIASDLGINLILITCDEDNTASERVIRRNGGVYEDTRIGKLRFWITTDGMA